ncbi:hypothetical protein [Paraburkholderia adhaesiva]|uniref:hypothetical protein n=1 Tax=Paraburkholderia adhaesiva TaxID=2883244 RepID=UPI001F297F1F|nr:hypothetical protein [Paraburkholderia adhaesiva]
MFARMMTSDTQGIRNASLPGEMVEGERISLFYDDDGRPFMKVWQSGYTSKIPVYGDVYVMNAAGANLWTFRPPLNFVGRNADGWKTVKVSPGAAKSG